MKSFSWAVVATVVVSPMMFSGCIKRKGAVEEAAGTVARAPAKATIKDLGIQVIPEGRDLGFPAGESQSSQGFGKNVIWTDTEMVASDVFSLPADNRPMYLVWKENALGARIVEAEYQHLIQATSNRPAKAVRRNSATFDADGRSWFIPLQDLIGKDYLQVSSSDQHSLSLSLDLEDGARHEFQIVFRMTGPLPKIKPVSRVVQRQGDAASVSRAAKAGMVVAQQVLVNPSARSLVVFARFEEASPLALNTYFDHLYAREGVPAPSYPHHDLYVSRAELQISRLQVERSRGVEQIPYRPGSWVRIDLSPHETMTIGAVLLPKAEVRRCALPPAVAPRKITFMVPSGLAMSWATIEVAEGWSIQGSSLAGLVQLQTVAADQSDGLARGPEELASMADLAVTAQEMIDPSIRLGTVSESAAPFSCQGVF